MKNTPPPFYKLRSIKLELEIAEKSEQFMSCEEFVFDLSLFNATYHA